MGVHRILNLIIALALLTAMHLHLPLLQIVAWSGMLVTYSQEAPLGEAIRQTFDGEHPCPLCLAIREALTEIPQDQLRTTPPPALKLLGHHHADWGPGLPPATPVVAAHPPAPPRRTDPPDVPPPRGSPASAPMPLAAV